MSHGVYPKFPPDDYTDFDRQPRKDNWEARRERTILKHDLSNIEVAEIAELYWRTEIPVREIADYYTIPFGDVALIAGYTVQKNAYCRRCRTYLRNYKRSDRGKVICRLCSANGYTDEVHVENLTWLVSNRLRHIRYRDYLKSDHWKAIREEMLVTRGYKCQMCGTKDGRLDVHHNTYRNRGRERTHELLVLCAQCHTDHHDRLKKRKQAKVSEVAS